MSNEEIESAYAQILQDFANDEKRYSSLSYGKEYATNYLLRRKALAELKSLYVQLGQKQFMTLAGSAILSDPYECLLDGLLGKLENDTLGNQYINELSEFNKKFLSKALTNYDPVLLDPVSLIKFLAESIGNDNISKGLVDAIRLHPDSTLFSKEYIESFGNSIKDNDWSKDDRTIEDIIQEGIKMADSFVMSNDYFEAPRMYENVMDIILEKAIDNTLLICDVIFKSILCYAIKDDSFRVGYNLDKIINENYPKFKESKQYAYLCIVRTAAKAKDNFFEVLNGAPKYNYDEYILATQQYCESISDSFLLTMIEKSKESILRNQ